MNTICSCKGCGCGQQLIDSVDTCHKEDSENKTNTKRNYWKMHIDGAARNNPGPAGAGIHIQNNNREVSKQGFYLGSKTNNQAEYLALVIGVCLLRNKIQDGDFVLIISDSQLLVRQMSGQYKVKSPLIRPLHAAAKQLLSGIEYDVGHVLREENVMADSLANDGVDYQRPVPPECLALLAQFDISL